MSNGLETLGYLSAVEVDEISAHRWGMEEAAKRLLLHPEGRRAALATTRLLDRLDVRRQIDELRPVWRAVERMIGHNGGNGYLDAALAHFNHVSDTVRHMGELMQHPIEQRLRFGALCRAVRESDGEPCALALHDRPGDPIGHLTRQRSPFDDTEAKDG